MHHNYSPSSEQLQYLSQWGKIDRDACLKKRSNWKVGGLAKAIIEPDSTHSLVSIIKYSAEHNLPNIFFGASTNLLFSDEGLSPLAITPGKKLNNLQLDGQTLIAECGVWVPQLARFANNHGLTGLEHIIGIPGTLGGLICMNGGSLRKAISEYLISVTAVSPEGVVKQFSKEECGFAYRSSVFQNNGYIILSASFQLPRDSSSKQSHSDMLNILRDRRQKFPRKLPNCGSVFVSNPAMYADYGTPGAIIERCGLKGVQQGDAQISPLHANFIVNNGNAKAQDILYLIYKIRRAVREATGYSMPSEVRYVEPNGAIIVAHEKAEDLYG